MNASDPIDTTDDATETAAEAEQPELSAIERTTLDAFRQLLNLAAVLKEPNLKTRVRQLQRAEGRAIAAQQRLAADRAAFAEYEKTTRAELDARATKLRAGEVELASKKERREDELVQREQRIRELERAWAFVAEDDDVRSGFRTAEFSALMKARAAYGIASDHGLDDIAKSMSEQFPARTVRRDQDGIEFPAFTSITRTEQSEAPATGARAPDLLPQNRTPERSAPARRGMRRAMEA